MYSETIAQEPTSGSPYTWSQVLDKREGTVHFYWYPAHPLIYQDDDGLTGLEYDIAQSFITYVEKEYQINLSENWVRADKFEDLIANISNQNGGVFGMSGLSITEGRKEVIQFTPPHLPDVCVLVSSADVPVKYSKSGFLETLEEITAITVKGTIFERELLEIQRTNNITFDIIYIDGISELIQTLENTSNAFGYVDVQAFLTEFEKGTSVRRQHFFPLKFPGLSFAYPKNSDWNEPVEAYFTSQQFHEDKDRIISKYFDPEIIQLLDRITTSVNIGPEEEIMILTRELELQYEELLDQNLQLKKDQGLLSLLIAIIVLVLLITAIIYTRYRMKLFANQVLASQQALIESKNRQLTSLNEEKSHLIKVLAHDLRSPIGRIVGFANLLLDDVHKDKQEMLEIIRKDGEKMDTLITKILDVEAIESKQKNLLIEDVYVVNIINDVVNDYQQKATNKGITIQTNFAKEPVILKADKVYLSQVIENLLSNAIKFSEAKTTVKIEIDEKKLIHIKDEGPGFAESERNMVFKKYQKLSARPTHGESSTGLGLSNVHMFVKLMNGIITFDSELGRGTSFHIELPRA